MKRNTLLNVIVLVWALLPILYLALTWDSIPEMVAIHFNAKLEPDKISNKTELWVPVSILAGVSALVFFLLKNINILDPKRRNSPPSPTFTRLAIGLVIFLTALNFIIIISASKGTTLISNLLFPLMGLLFAFIGNYMNNIKPNYFAGIRLPWTLSDNDNWRKTHQLAGKLWFWGGLLFAIVSLILPVKIILPIMVSIILLMTVIPGVYSYRLFKSKSRLSE